ncbi:MAG: ArnT family glycosyltransferase, partial [Stenotrophobium sp.]
MSAPLRYGALTALFLCLLWTGLGLTGHAPWKPDEAYTFGLVLHILHSGDWVIPTLAGEPFMEKPPIFFITAAFFCKLAGGWLPLHDAARLASGFYLLLTLLCISLTAAELGDRKGRITAPLIFISCIGLFELSHRLQTDISLMAGVALALYGLALAPRRAVAGGLWLGTGTGLAFLSKGLIGPGFVGLCTLGMLGCVHWRQRNFFHSWLWALATALPWLLIWPLLLYLRAPDQFHVWLWDNNISRFVGTSDSGLGPRSEAWFYTKTLPWFLWPALPLGLWGLWRSAGTGRLESPRMQLPLLSFLIMLACLAVAHDARSNYALPLLAPTALLGSLGSAELRESGRKIWYGCGALLFGLLALILWVLWFCMLMDAPAFLMAKLQHAEPGYVEHLRPFAVTVAALLTLGWCVLITRLRGEDASWSWAAGMTLAWGLFSTLALPAVDYGRSYRSVMTELAAHLDPRSCL